MSESYNFHYLRLAYNKPIRKGQVIKYKGDKATIIGTTKENNLKIKIHKNKKEIIIHPTWKVEYI